MSFLDDWVPIMQIATDKTFGYYSAYWTNDALLNENSAPSDNVNAKYASFLNVPFDTIRMCSNIENTNCASYTFDKTWESAKQLFSSGFQRAKDQDQAEIIKVFGPKKGDYSVCLP